MEATMYELHARSHFGQEGGVPGSGFTEGLFKLCDVSDATNLAKLESVYPEHVAAWRKALTG